MHRSLCLVVLLAACGQSGTPGKDHADRGVTVELAPAESATMPPQPAPTPQSVPAPVEAPETRAAPETAPPPAPPAEPDKKKEAAEPAPQKKQKDSSGKSGTATKDSRFRAASLRLPDRVVARTIGRIGYPCGEVVSTERVTTAGSARIYRVTCSSGDSYQATDRGRSMRFRKWSGVPSD